MFLVILVSCGTGSNSTKESCVNENTEDIIIRWGGHNIKTQYLSGWQIDANAKLLSFIKKDNKSEYEYTEIGEIDIDKFCEILKITQKYFFEIQALKGHLRYFPELPAKAYLTMYLNRRQKTKY